MRFRWFAIVLLINAFVACGDDGVPAPIASARPSTTVTAPWKDGNRIPRRYTCDGGDVSPPLEWTPVPGADEYAVVMTDRDASGFVHWVVWNISSDTRRIGARQEPRGAISGANGFGDVGYGGPCPPEGDDPHVYEVTVLAIDRHPTDELPEGASAGDLYDAIECCVEGRGDLTGTYQRAG